MLYYHFQAYSHAKCSSKNTDDFFSIHQKKIKKNLSSQNQNEFVFVNRTFFINYFNFVLKK